MALHFSNPWFRRKCVQSNSPDNPIHHYNVEVLNLFDPELQLINWTSDWKQIKKIVKLIEKVWSSANIGLRL